MPSVTNRFTSSAVALRYADARPNVHPQVISRIAAATGTSRFQRALDIGCGTGQSARALVEICEAVEAVDLSPQMIAAADFQAPVRFFVAAAERLPFSANTFDLATVGLAFHWFDQAAFLREAWRVLKPSAWLAIYNHGFTGEMAKNPDFLAWSREIYLSRFPIPERNATSLDVDLASRHGFDFVASEQFVNEEAMSAERFAAYLVTQTNVLAAAETGTMSLPEAQQWIEAEVKPYFQNACQSLRFSGSICLLRRLAHADLRANSPA